MDRTAVAKQLIRLAKELVSSPHMVLITHRDDGTEYFARSLWECLSATDRNVYREVLKTEDEANIDNVTGIPSSFFRSREHELLRKYGFGREYTYRKG